MKIINLSEAKKAEFITSFFMLFLYFQIGLYRCLHGKEKKKSRRKVQLS